MSVYKDAEDCYIHGVWPKCNIIPKECSTSGGGDIDAEPPELVINNPEQDFVYDSRSVLLDTEVDEESDIYYYDNINGRGIWTRVCTDCMGYARKRNFDEGFNDITFKAEDVVGNEVYVNRTFFVDSKKPRVKKTEPRRGYADGSFYVEFQEASPVSLMLYYGDANPGMRTQEINLNMCENIKGKSDKFACDVEVNLQDYDGKEIEYWFNVSDIAGSSHENKPTILQVDTTFPVINFFDYNIDGKYVTFTFNITEINFDEVEYIDWVDTRPRWRRLCSRLKEGICEKRKSFRTGFHNIDLQVVDEAGNSVGRHIEFDVIY